MGNRGLCPTTGITSLFFLILAKLPLANYPRRVLIWCRCESTRIPPMWPGFIFRTWNLLVPYFQWLLREVFSSSPQKPTFDLFIWFALNYLFVNFSLQCPHLMLQRWKTCSFLSFFLSFLTMQKVRLDSTPYRRLKDWNLESGPCLEMAMDGAFQGMKFFVDSIIIRALLKHETAKQSTKTPCVTPPFIEY